MTNLIWITDEDARVIDPETHTRDEIEDMAIEASSLNAEFCERVDEDYPDLMIYGVMYRASDIMRACDQVHYSEEFNNFVDRNYTQVNLDDYSDEIPADDDTTTAS